MKSKLRLENSNSRLWLIIALAAILLPTMISGRTTDSGADPSHNRELAIKEKACNSD